MVSRLPVINAEGEVADLSEVDPSIFKPASEVLPPDLYANLIALNKQRGLRGPQKNPTKIPTTIRFDADVLAELKASGKGWQTRVNAAVRDWLKTQAHN
jgi:uncharacterized protein (DUF4415 family)